MSWDEYSDSAAGREHAILRSVVAAAGRLIGRRDEVAAITQAMNRADVTGVVIRGDAGVGKTRLVEAAVEVAGEAGFVVFRIRGDEALVEVPLAAFAPMFAGQPAGDVSDFVALRNELRSAAAGRPLLLTIDDAHFLDDASAVLVHQLATELVAFVVVAMRSGVVPPAAITSLWKDHLAVRIDIGPLGRAEVADLVQAAAGHPPAIDLESALWERSGGNALFIRELVAAARNAGTITERDGMLTLTGPLPAPTTVVELVASRLATLDEPQRRAAGILALGGALDVELLERLVDPEALVGLEEAGLVRAEDVGERLEVSFVHPLHAEAVRQSIGRLTSRQLRRQLADALEADRAGSDHVLRIVTLRLDAGAASSTVLLVEATRLARRRHDPALAERLARATMEQEPSMSAGLAVANAVWEQGRHEQAALALADPRIDRSSASPKERAAEAEVAAWIYFWGLGRAELALTGLREAAAKAPADSVDTLLADVAAIEAMRGRPRASLEVVAPGGAIAAQPLGCFALVTAMTTAGRPAAALDEVELRSIDASGPWQFAASAIGLALIDAGRCAEATELGLERLEAAVHAGSRHARCCWSIVLGQAQMWQGRTDAGRRWFEDAAQLAVGSPGGVYLRRWGLNGAMFCAVLLGDRDGANELSRALDVMPAHDAVVPELNGQIARRWMQAGDGDVAGAVDGLLRLADHAIAAGRDGAAVRMLMDATRLLGDPDPAASWIAAHPLELDGGFLPVVIEWIEALGRTDGDSLATIAERFVAADCPVLAAEAASAAWSIARSSAADERLVAVRARRVQELRATFGHASTPALADAPIELPLSRREREIATVVAGGMTSREVAHTLVIGVRTVESHLARVYDKLGIHSRAELAAALGIERTPVG